jgi:hypothetical protein
MVAKPVPGKRYFTVEQANATLPLVRVIVHDITELARELRDRHERLSRIRPGQRGRSDAHEEELLQAQSDFEKGKERMQEYQRELAQLGIELKDYFVGLIDFPCWMNGREVYLCWRMGEPEVAHWHELDAGFAGRKRLGAVLSSQ